MHYKSNIVESAILIELETKLTSLMRSEMIQKKRHAFKLYYETQHKIIKTAEDELKKNNTLDNNAINLFCLTYSKQMVDLNQDTISKISKIEARYQEQAKIISNVCQNLKQALLTQASNFPKIYEAQIIYRQTIFRIEIAYNTLSNKLAQDNKQQEAIDFKEYHDRYHRAVQKELHGYLASSIESFNIVANTVGLESVSADFQWPGSSRPIKQPTGIHPLLTYTDFKRELVRAFKVNQHQSAELIRIFHTDIPQDCGIQLSETIHALDLDNDLSIFKHQCFFKTSPSLPDSNQLYVELFTDRALLTLSSPYGSVIKKWYEPTTRVSYTSFKELMQDSNMMQTIQANTALFILDIYENTGTLWRFNAFDYAMENVYGFKEHVIKTIFTYNKLLARNHGLESLILNNEHLRLSAGRDYCSFDKTPLYLLEKERLAEQDIAKKAYESKRKLPQEEYEAELEKLMYWKTDICEQAKNKYASILRNIGQEIIVNELQQHELLCNTVDNDLKSTDKPLQQHTRPFFSPQKPAVDAPIETVTTTKSSISPLMLRGIIY